MEGYHYNLEDGGDEGLPIIIRVRSFARIYKIYYPLSEKIIEQITKPLHCKLWMKLKKEN